MRSRPPLILLREFDYPCDCSSTNQNIRIVAFPRRISQMKHSRSLLDPKYYTAPIARFQAAISYFSVFPPHTLYYHVSSRVDAGRIRPQRPLVEEQRSVILLLSLCARYQFKVLYTGILILNIFLTIPLMSASINGLDSSLVNGKVCDFRYSSFLELVWVRSANSSILAGIFQSPHREGIRYGIFLLFLSSLI